MAHHPLNRMAGRYDMKALTSVYALLEDHIVDGPKGKTIDFSDAMSVRHLNAALLQLHYGIKSWMLPPNYLVPPIPGRLDYILHMSDLLKSDKHKNRDREINLLDIGTGASLIYGLLAAAELSWNVVASDVDDDSLKSCEQILKHNPEMAKLIQLRKQKNKNYFFKGIIQTEEFYDVIVCNPPFYGHINEAAQANARKNKKLHKGRDKIIGRNFGGVTSELVYPGGERSFIKNMIKESKAYGQQVRWFSSLVSSGSNVTPLVSILREQRIKHRVIENTHGQKSSRILCWSFLKQVKGRSK